MSMGYLARLSALEGTYQSKSTEGGPGHGTLMKKHKRKVSPYTGLFIQPQKLLCESSDKPCVQASISSLRKYGYDLRDRDQWKLFPRSIKRDTIITYNVDAHAV